MSEIYLRWNIEKHNYERSVPKSLPAIPVCLVSTWACTHEAWSWGCQTVEGKAWAAQPGVDKTGWLLDKEVGGHTQIKTYLGFIQRKVAQPCWYNECSSSLGGYHHSPWHSHALLHQPRSWLQWPPRDIELQQCFWNPCVNPTSHWDSPAGLIRWKFDMICIPCLNWK